MIGAVFPPASHGVTMPTCVLRILLLLPLLAAFTFDARAAEPLTAKQKEEVERVIHDYFLKHPEFMVEVLRAAEGKLKAQRNSEAKNAITGKRQELLRDPTTPVGGNPDGDVTIVEFFDYRCPYCKQVEPAIEALVREDRKIRIVYKEFPVLGPESVYASRMALAARKQGKYAAFHDAMMAVHGAVNEESIVKTAEAAGLDVAQAKLDMDSAEVKDSLKRNYALADALDIQGTPAFIVGDTLVPGATDIEALRKLVIEARKG
jgi:protein-disulfide isomerase